MVECQLFGERIDLPKPIVDEFVRLRALERQFQDEERDRLLREWESKYGSLPEPPTSRLVLYEG